MRIILFILVLFLILLAGLVGTTVGVQVGIQIVDRFLPGELQATAASGRLVDRFELHDLTYRDQTTEVELDRATIDWHSLALLRRSVLIESLSIGSLNIVTRPDDTAEPVEPHALPLGIEVRALDIDSVNYHDTDIDTLVQLRKIHLRLSAHDDRVVIRQLSATGDNFIASLSGQLQLAENWPLQADFNYSLALPDLPPNLADIDGQGRVAGDLRQLTIAHRTTTPITSELDLTVTDIIGKAAWHGRLTASDVELQSFVDIDGRADIEIGIDGDLTRSHLDITTILRGELAADWMLTTELAHAEQNLIHIVSLQFEDRDRHFDLIGQGQLTFIEEPVLEFTGEWRYLADEPATGKLLVNGKPEDYRIELTALTEIPITSGWSLRGRGDTGSLTIEALRGELASGTIDAHGQIDWQQDIPEFEFRGEWNELALTVEDDVPLYAPAGEFRLSGTPEHYLIELAGKLVTNDWPALDVSLQADGDAEQLNISLLEIGLLDGQLRADGHIEWLTSPGAVLNVSGDGINPGSHWPDWPGRLDLGTVLVVEQKDDHWEVALEGLAVQGRLRGFPLQASGSLLAGADDYHVEKLVIRSGDSLLSADGRIGSTNRLDWRLQSPNLEQLWPDAGGRVDGQGRLRGSLTAPEVTAELSGQTIRTPWLNAETIDAELDLDTSTNRFDANINAIEVQAADQTIKRALIHSQGLLDQHSLAVEIEMPDRLFKTTGNGSLRDDTWNLTLDQSRISDPTLGNWELAEPLEMSLNQTAIRVERHCWRQQSAQLCGRGSWRQADTWETELELAGLQLGEHIVLPDELPSVTGAIDSQLSARGKLMDVDSINGSFTLSGGRLQPDAGIEPMIIDRLTLDIADTAEGVALNLSSAFGGDYPGELQGELRTGRLQLDPQAMSTMPIEGQIHAALGDLRPLLAVYTDLDAREATATLDASIAGRVEAPELTGKLQLSAARVIIIEAGLELSEFELEITGSPDGELTLNGMAVTAPGKLEFDGRLQFADAGILISDMSIDGENFETLNLPEAWVLTSPELKVGHAEGVLQITGHVTVPEAMLEPLEAGGAIRVSADEEIVTPDMEEHQREPLPIAVAMQLRLGDEVRFRGPGFRGRLTGTLDIRQQPGRPATAEGMLNIVDGVYGAYGQELRITTGQIIYTGQTLDDPQLNIRAVRTIRNVQAGIRAFGSARRPEAELFSTPSMPDADILSYIVVGRPVSGLTTGEGNMLMDAAVAMGVRGTESLRQDIAGTLGLDELTLTAGGVGDTDARLTVGKYLTPRLYVSYGAGLVETAVDTMRLRYTITRWLALEAEQGRGTGADLLYQLER